jgi:hypothetical protein
MRVSKIMPVIDAHPFQPFETFGKLGHLVDCVSGD